MKIISVSKCASVTKVEYSEGEKIFRAVIAASWASGLMTCDQFPVPKIMGASEIEDIRKHIEWE